MVIDVYSYRGKTFIASHGDVFVCNFVLFGCNQISFQKIISFSKDSTIFNMIKVSFLVELGGDLLLVLNR